MCHNYIRLIAQEHDERGEGSETNKIYWKSLRIGPKFKNSSKPSNAFLALDNVSQYFAVFKNYNIQLFSRLVSLTEETLFLNQFSKTIFSRIDSFLCDNP